MRSASELMRYGIRASDGHLGDVHDLYLDDETWMVRYVVVDAGDLLSHRPVLVPPVTVLSVDKSHPVLEVGLKIEQVRNSPHIDRDSPVSRQQEKAYSDYYGIPYYWLSRGAAWASPVHPQGEDLAADPAADMGDPHLRSAKELLRYDVQAVDAGVGAVQDLLVDVDSWELRYLVVDTRRWWPGGHVLIAPEWVRSISWAERTVSLDLTSDAVKDAPEWDPASPPERKYEARLYAHFGKPPAGVEAMAVGNSRADVPGDG